MYQSVYYIERSNNTFADNLATFGLAFVLNGIAQGRASVRMEDVGSAFAVIVEPAIQAEWVEECRFFVGAPFLATYDRKLQTKVVKGCSLPLSALPAESNDILVDYEVERDNNTQFFAWMKQLSDQEKRLAVRGELRGPVAPHPDWDLFRAINPAALQGYNSLIAEWWQAQAAFPELLQILLKMTATMPNDVDGADQAWVRIAKARGLSKPKDATAAQLLNPAQGKGVNSAKMVWRTPGQMKSFWLLEWLKLVGMRYGGITRTLRGVKDRKTYVLAPTRLAWHQHVAIMQQFQRAMAGSATAVKLDILAALRYTVALLKHYEGARLEDLEAELFGHSANDLVSGLHTAFYKDMGNAIVTMNIAAINLPAWVKPDSRESLVLLQNALDEHMTIVRTLDEARGDQFDLLCLYRDFLSANDLRPFFQFTTAYSGFIVSQRERGIRVRQFTTTTLEVIFVNSNNLSIQRIIQTPGFKNIAYAIRQATVTAQYWKSEGKRLYDVRYGLGQQLARKGSYTSDFMTELTKFIHDYNAENAQTLEHLKDRHGSKIPKEISKRLRRSIKTSDVDEIAQLIDEHQDSRLICNLLVAYGYAREPFEGRDGDTDSGLDSFDTEAPDDTITEEVEE